MKAKWLIPTPYPPTKKNICNLHLGCPSPKNKHVKRVGILYHNDRILFTSILSFIPSDPFDSPSDPWDSPSDPWDSPSDPWDWLYPWRIHEKCSKNQRLDPPIYGGVWPCFSQGSFWISSSHQALEMPWILGWYILQSKSTIQVGKIYFKGLWEW